MEKRTYLLASLLNIFSLFQLAGSAQNIGDFSRLKIHPFTNLDWKQENKKQVLPIVKLFEKYNVVILSENTHFDGAVRDAQCMIIKELIDAGIINTIYLESSWLNINRINSILEKKGALAIPDTHQYLGSSELQYWDNCGFWDEYIAPAIIKGKIDLVGFDIGGPIRH